LKSNTGSSRFTAPACASTPRSTSTSNWPPAKPCSTAPPPTSAATAGRATSTTSSYKHPVWIQSIEKGSYIHGIVTEVAPRRATVSLGAQSVTLAPADWSWTRNPTADSFLKTGDIVYIRIETVAADGALTASLQQDSGAQAALMAIDNATGNVIAMIGGRDFALSQFNRATQAQREVGSSFKPYVYTTAIENGAKPTDIIIDGPVTFPSPSGPYTPHNYEADYRGAMTLLNAFAESRNIPALKLADRYGIRKVIETAHRFGVTSNIPAFLPIAIGSADISLEEQVAAYSVFPNDGVRIEPRYIRNVTQADGLPLESSSGAVTEVISVDTARTMMQLLQAVVRQGTATAALQLKHPLGGKTGTTNDFTDAWFIGFSPSITCGVWIGYDDHQTLGEKETGAKAALPIWMDFMRAAIANKPNEAFPLQGAPKKTIDVVQEGASLDSTEPPTDAPAKAEPASSPNRQTVDTESPTEPHTPPPSPDQPHPATPKQQPDNPTATPPQAAPAPKNAAPTAPNEHTGVSNPPPDTD
jgi:penicillin-binding protein 1A